MQSNSIAKYECGRQLFDCSQSKAVGSNRKQSAPAEIAVRLAVRCAVLLLVTANATSFAQDLIKQDRRVFADGLMSRGLYQLAVPEYRALAADTSTSELDVVLYRLAECERQANNFDASEKACAELLTKFPQSPMRFRARLTRGLILKSLGRMEEAALVLEELATDPDSDTELSSTALFHAGEVRESLGNYAAAEKRYNLLIQRAEQPNSSKEISELGAYAALRIAAIKALANTDDGNTDAIKRYAVIAEKPFSPRIGAEAIFQSASLFYKIGKYDDSVTQYRNLVAKYPNDIRISDAKVPSAWANFMAGRYADALDIVRDESKIPEDSRFDAAYIKANALAQLEQRKDAIAAYDALLSMPAASPEAKSVLNAARYERIVILFKNGDFKKLLEDAANIKDPPAGKLADFLWLQAQAAESLGDEARAVQFYRMLSEKCPNCDLAPDALYRLAYQQQKQEAYLEASRSYLTLATSFPTNSLVPQALFSSGFCLARAGKSAEALRDWNELIAKYPDDTMVPVALFQKAMEEIRLGLSREAAASLDAIIAKPGKTHQDRLAEAQFWRARICYDEKEFAAAEKHLRACIAGQPADDIRHEADFLLGLSLQAQGRNQDAATCFQPLLSETTKDKFTDDRLAWLAEFQLSQGKYEQARDAAKELAGRPTSKEWVQVGNVLAARAYLALSDTNNATASFRLAADSESRTKYSSEAALRLGELLLAEGSASAVAEATDYLKAAINRASSQELVSVRAKAYYTLAACTEKRGAKEEAARYYMAVALLFDDKDTVPPALKKAAELYGELGMQREKEAAEQELATRYPEGKK